MEPSATPRRHSDHLPPTGTEQAQPAESETPCSSLLTSKTERLCAGIRANGERCRARASALHDFCSFHRGDLQETLRAGRVRGGQQRRYEITALEEQAASLLSLGLDSRGGIQAGLDNLLRQVFLGKVAPKYIAAVTRIYATALRNIERTEAGAEDHTFNAYTAGLAANHRLRAEVEAANQAREAAELRRRNEHQEAVRRLLDEFDNNGTSAKPLHAPGRA